MDPAWELIKSRSEQDISAPRTEIKLIRSAPEVTLKSILKSSESNRQMGAITSGPPKDRKGHWDPQVEVFNFVGDSSVIISKADLSEETDQHERKAAYVKSKTRFHPSQDQVPFLEDFESIKLCGNVIP